MLRAVETGRRLADADAVAPELEVHVTTGDDAELVLADGTTVALARDTLSVSGPARDLLVIVNGRPVTRVRGSAVHVDLSASEFARASGWRAAPSMLTAAVTEDDAAPRRHRYATTPIAPAAGEPVTVLVHAEEAAAVIVRDLATGQAVDAVRTDADEWSAVLPGRPAGTVVRYEVEVRGEAGELTTIADAGTDYAFPWPGIVFHRPHHTEFAYAVGAATTPDWLADAVVYHVLVDRFAGPAGEPVRADAVSLLGFAGGTVSGLTARLDHIAGLGVNALLVSPLHAGHMHVCYDVCDHFAVEPRLGSENDVRALCAAAHERGMRVILDWEASYFGCQHPFVASARRDPRGEHGDWFLRGEGGRLLGWYGGNPTFVPVNHENAAARRHLIDAARHWLALGVDGFRLDSAHAASFAFWSEFGAAVHGTDPAPGVVTIAEATRPLAFCRGYEGRLSGFLDFEASAALRGFAGDGTVAPSALDEVLSERDTLPANLTAACFVECHDHDRFSWIAGGDRNRLLLALTLLLTLPGPPILYYGTEIGLDQDTAGDVDLVARAPMRWDTPADSELYGAVRALVERRNASAALRRGARRTLLVDDASGCYAFARELDGEAVVVVANASGRHATPTIGAARVDLPPLTAVVLDGADALEALR